MLVRHDPLTFVCTGSSVADFDPSGGPVACRFFLVLAC
jgi:hypothetical protein